MPVAAGRQRRTVLTSALDEAFAAVERLAGGLGTALLALVTLAGVIVVGAASLLGVGLLFLPLALSASRAVADRERRRLNRWGFEVISPYPALLDEHGTRLRAALADPATRRDICWLGCHATGGLILGLLGVVLPILAVRDLSFPLWWRLLPAEQATASLGFPVSGWPAVTAVAFMGLGWAAIIAGLGPRMARLQAAPGLRLLNPHPDSNLSGRVAELAATRAAALQAHTAELRRIERSLHDGAQNRLVAVLVLTTAAQRALSRDPAAVEAILDRVHNAAEQALGELRTVVRSILPPVLEQRGLDGAVAALAAECPVPCRVTVAVPRRCPASVEATAYYAIAEALTNVAKHSAATRAEVEVTQQDGRLRLRVHDNGQGGADERAGSGLAGIRRRIEAHDGTARVTSPPNGPTTIDMDLPCAS